MIISRTPFRISFFGGGTDYPSWYRKHGGAVLATTIDKYCYLMVRYLPPFFGHKYRLVYSQSEDCQALDDISHPAIRESLRFLALERGISIHHDGDLPARSGMGSSSSFTVGLLHALYALQGIMPTKKRLAQESTHIEQQLIKETVGSQDQVMTACGGFNHIQFHPDNDVSVTPITITTERKEDLNSHLMLFYTGIIRTAANVADSFVNILDQRKQQLRIMKDLVEEGLDTLTRGGDISSFGELLDEAWLMKRELSSRVSNPTIDKLYEQAKNAGALGGKLTGAGGGGFLLLFVPPEAQLKVKKALGNLIHVPFKFDNQGSQIIFHDTEEDFSQQEKYRDGQIIGKFKELPQSQEEVLEMTTGESVQANNSNYSLPIQPRKEVVR